MVFKNLSKNLLLYVILLFVIFFLFWASFAQVDETVVAIGQVIPSSKTQDIQSLDGGIIEKVFVREGDVVNKDQALIKLNDVRYSSSFQENEVKYYSLKAKLIRLSAEEQNSDVIQFPVSLNQDYPDLVKGETNLFYANRKQFKAKMSSLEENIKIVKGEYENFKKLEAEQIIPKIELTKVKKELNDLLGKSEYESNSYYSSIKDEIAKTKTEYDSLEQLLSGYKDRLDRTLLTSPAYGVVKKVNISTMGAIVKSGDTIIEIVPLDDELLVEGKIQPNKIAFIDPDQEVNIAISAYDSSIYGTLKGKIKHIGADTIVESDPYGKNQSYYKIIVKSNSNNIQYKGRSLPIIPGMQATINIITGERTVLQYILKPLIKAKLNAFREI